MQKKKSRLIKLFEPPTHDKPSIMRVALIIWILGILVGWAFGKDLSVPVASITAILAGAKGWQSVLEHRKK
jgi:hypothetical protein